MKIQKLVSNLSASIGSPIKLIREQNRKDIAKILVYELKINREQRVKIDFVEDYKRIQDWAKANNI